MNDNTASRRPALPPGVSVNTGPTPTDAPNRKVSPALRRNLKRSRIAEAEQDQGGPLTPTQRTRICGVVDRELNDLESKGLLG